MLQKFLLGPLRISVLNVRVGAGVGINRAVSDCLLRQSGKILLINYYNSSAYLELDTRRWSQETVSEILISSEWSSAVRRNSYTSNSSCSNFKTLSVWYIIHNHLGCLSKMLGWFLSRKSVGHTLRNLCNGSVPPGWCQKIPKQLNRNSYFQDVEMQADVAQLGNCSNVGS